MVLSATSMSSRVMSTAGKAAKPVELQLLSGWTTSHLRHAAGRAVGQIMATPPIRLALFLADPMPTPWTWLMVPTAIGGGK
jgi:hypothetical protein